MYFEQFFVEGLGCASYLVGSESRREAVIVDPDRETGKYLAAAERLGVRITHILETHLHADHVSGNTALAAKTGADIYVHEAAQARFPHRPLKDGDVIEIGEVRIQVKHTPGHTPESVTLLVSDTRRSAEPWIALTGDLLFVGDVGRPDLVGPAAARSISEAAGRLYDSLYEKVLPLDDSLMVYPGHGAGSLCGRSIANLRSTSLGFERKFNPALQLGDRGAFVEFMTNDLPEQPGNHQRIKTINRDGPQPLAEIQARPLGIQEAIPYFQRGAALLDTRPKAEFVELHVPGSVHLPADDQLSNRVGFVLPPDLPVILLVSDEAAFQRAVLSLRRVGYENVAGFLQGGIAEWEAAGLPVASGDIQDLTPAELKDLLSGGEPPLVLDVREPWEYTRGHLPGAVLIPLGQLASRLEELDPQQPVVAVCATGQRSQSAAALLGQKGFARIFNLLEGTHGWQMAGFQIERPAR